MTASNVCSYRKSYNWHPSCSSAKGFLAIYLPTAQVEAMTPKIKFAQGNITQFEVNHGIPLEAAYLLSHNYSILLGLISTSSLPRLLNKRQGHQLFSSSQAI